MTHTCFSRQRSPFASAFCLAFALLGAASPAFADQKADLHVLRVFSEGANVGGFFPVENISADCLWGLMYVDLTSPAGRGQLALLLQAKAMNLKLQRVDYAKNGNGTCSATSIHIE